MLLLAYIVDADVRFRAARHLAGQLFADEEIWRAPQPLRAFYGIVVRQGEQIHPATLQKCVDFLGIAITFTANATDNRGRGGSGEVGVDVQVALHEIEYDSGLLLGHDSGAKVLKTLPLNALAIVHHHFTEH